MKGGFATAAAVLATMGIGSLTTFIARRFLYPVPYVAAASVTRNLPHGVELVSTRDTRLPGSYRLTRGLQDVIVGSIISSTTSTLVRECSTAVDVGPWRWDALMADPAEYDTAVAVTHVIHVHGQSLGPKQTLRGIKVWTGLGASSEVLDITHLRMRALDPAASDLIAERVMDARRHGAEKVVLQGWSAGALACSAAVRRVPVDAVVAVAPLLNIRFALRAAVAAAHLPRLLGSISYGLLTTTSVHRLAGAPTPLTTTTWQTAAVPLLVMRSRADGFLDEADVERLRREKNVTIVTFDTAPHTLEWNESPEKWEQAIKKFAGAHSLAG